MRVLGWDSQLLSGYKCIYIYIYIQMYVQIYIYISWMQPQRGRASLSPFCQQCLGTITTWTAAKTLLQEGGYWGISLQRDQTIHIVIPQAAGYPWWKRGALRNISTGETRAQFFVVISAPCPDMSYKCPSDRFKGIFVTIWGHIQVHPIIGEYWGCFELYNYIYIYTYILSFIYMSLHRYSYSILFSF